MKKISSFVAVASAAFILSAVQPANAIGISDLISTIQKKITKTTAYSTIQSTLCKKADLFSGVVSLRSGSGTLCTIKPVAAFALLLCKGYSDFNGSGCDNNAVKLFPAGATPAPGPYLADEIRKGATDAVKLACPVVAAATAEVGIGVVLAPACVAIGAM